VEGDPELGRPNFVRGGAVSVSLAAPAPPGPRVVPGMEGVSTTVVVERMSK